MKGAVVQLLSLVAAAGFAVAAFSLLMASIFLMRALFA